MNNLKTSFKKEQRRIDRRSGPDFWVKFINAMSLLVWAVMIIILLLIDKAKPEIESFFSNLFQLQLRQSWDLHFLTISFILSIFMLIFTSFTLFVNRKRHRRKTDKYSKSVIIMMFFSLFIIIFFFYKL